MLMKCHFLQSVVVNNLDVIDAITLPAETDSPLIVYPNAVLAGTVAFQRLEPVARRRIQFIERRNKIKLYQFSDGNTANRLPAAACSRFEKPPRLAVGETVDHSDLLYNVLRYMASVIR